MSFPNATAGVDYRGVPLSGAPRFEQPAIVTHWHRRALGEGAVADRDIARKSSDPHPGSVAAFEDRCVHDVYSCSCWWLSSVALTPKVISESQK